MSKRIIAGLGVVAGLAVALAPVATFAEGEIGVQEDTLEVTIEAMCDFGYDANADGDYADTSSGDVAAVTHTDGNSSNGTWDSNAPSYTAAVYDDGAVTTQGTGADTLSGTMTAGTTDADFGSTALTVVCNNTAGYHITAEGTDLERTSGDSTPIVAAAGASSVTGLWGSTNTSKWSYTPALSGNASGQGGTFQFESGVSNTELAAPASAASIVKNTAATDAAGDTLTVTYSVGLVSNQGAGTYSGTMTYTLIQGQAS